MILSSSNIVYYFIVYSNDYTIARDLTTEPGVAYIGMNFDEETHRRSSALKRPMLYYPT